MDTQPKKWPAVVSYLTWIGWIVAFFMGDRKDPFTLRHLNQALVLNLIETVGALIARMGGIFGTVGGIIDIAVLVLWIMGIARAAKGSDEPLPIIGDWVIFS